LREIVVPHADATKRLRRNCAHNLINLTAKLVARFPRGNGDRNDDARWLLFAKSYGRGAHCRSGRQSIINQDYNSTFHVRRRTVTTIGSFTPF
jgi:hypothetical protein